MLFNIVLSIRRLQRWCLLNIKMLPRTLIIEPNIRDYFSILVLTYKKKQPPPQKKPVIISQSMAE